MQDHAVVQQRIEDQLALDLNASPRQVQAAVGLLDEGATVPFIARYRKEVTGGLDDGALRLLEERLTYLRDLEDRRSSVLSAIDEQGKLTGELRKRIDGASTKQALEDLYLPFKKKRRTKGQVARELGLEPLAQTLLEKPFFDPEREAQKYLNKDVPTVAAALEGASHILVEHMAEDAALIGRLREQLAEYGFVRSRLVKGKEEEGAKFRDYFDYSERLKRIPGHRALALLRGTREGILKMDLIPESALLEDPKSQSRAEQNVARHFRVRDNGRPCDEMLLKCVSECWKQKLLPSLRNEAFSALRTAAESQAIGVFAQNLRDLLLAAPAGGRVTMGIDPGLRTGCKVVVVDAQGTLRDHATIYPHVPQRKEREALDVMARMCMKYKVSLIAIGNGTASRETDRLVAKLLKNDPGLGMEKLMVSEAGASVYSASELAAKEFPNLDVSIRGAVSIARRLQDPLAELVKIEPKSIGVGQYQHDVNQGELGRKLDAVVEDCVNAVGVDVNLASAPLLAHVSGLSKTLAGNIVAYREEHGAFRDRKTLMKVPRMGAKSFEQAAGFLRIREGRNPLDGSAVHPEAYEVAERIVRASGSHVAALMKDPTPLRSLKPQDFTDKRFGLPTVKDIFAELEKPGRDPRGSFQGAQFREGVEEITDLEEGMQLEGVVTNVTNFGAFVDVGVHQDGLVHISQLANTFVNDPHQIVKAGQVVQVRVLEVDVRRKRISLSMKD